MIRINLLGSPKPKGKKGPAISMPSFELGNLGGPVVQVAAVLLIAGALNYGYWYQLDREKKSIEVQSRLRNKRIANWLTSRCGIWSGRSKPILTSAVWM